MKTVITRRNFIDSSILLFLSLHFYPTLANEDLDFRKMMQPVKPFSILKSENWYIWGGSMVRTKDGKCHLLFARWEKKYGFNAWVSKSEIAYAVADNPLGPYEIKGTALERRPGFWDADNTHNPTL